MRSRVAHLAAAAALLLPGAVGGRAGAAGACDPWGPSPGPALVGDRDGAGGAYLGVDGSRGAYAGWESDRWYAEAEGGPGGVLVHGSTKPRGDTLNAHGWAGAGGASVCVGQGDAKVLEVP